MKIKDSDYFNTEYDLYFEALRLFLENSRGSVEVGEYESRSLYK